MFKTFLLILGKIILEIIKAFIYWGLITIILAYYVFFIEPKQLTTENYTLYNKNIKKDLKIVHFSDVHISKWSSEKFLTNLTDSINNENPDIVLFTGDLFDNYYNDEKYLKEKEVFIIETLSNINAKYGKFAVIGNHDCNNKINMEYFEEIMKKTGFTYLNGSDLENYSFTIEDLNVNLFGINTSYKKDLENSLRKENSNSSLNLLLLHAPDYISDMDIKEIDFAFAGHTHGGQVNILYLNKFILPKGGEKYIKGEYIINEKTTLFVNSGIGTTRIPVRFLMKPQISVYNVLKEN